MIIIYSLLYILFGYVALGLAYRLGDDIDKRSFKYDPGFRLATVFLWPAFVLLCAALWLSELVMYGRKKRD